MKELQCDIWEQECDALCVTTNGVVKANGKSVMGKGIALEAVQRFPGIDKTLGTMINAGGNVVYLLHWAPRLKDHRKVTIDVNEPPYSILSFPTKGHWRDKSSLDLIQTSCLQLINLVGSFGWNKVLLPRPGCGNGGLDWEREVKPIVKELLDDRFTICYR